MQLIRGLHNLKPGHRGCVATIGNFDGVHLGHQAIIGQLAEKGAELHLPTTVIVFEPQPPEYFQSPDKVPPRLTRLREKIQALRRYSVDRVLCLRFDAHLANMPAEEFILSQEQTKERFIRESTALSKLFALAVPHEEALMARQKKR